MTAVLERHHFQFSRDSEYFIRAELEKQTGQPADAFFDVLVKELVDNALDAAETAGRSPEVAIRIEYATNTHCADIIRLHIADNGDGMPPEVVEKILDFRTRTSDKAAYRGSTRGAQGNALKTVFGIPVALGLDRSEVEILTRGVRHRIAAWLDPAGAVRTEHRTERTFATGTTIGITVPAHRWLSIQPRDWAFAYALFNPHAEVKIGEFIEGGKRAYTDPDGPPDFYLPTDPAWKRYRPGDPASPHWYGADEFARLVQLYIHQADMPLRAFVQQFKGLTGSAKAKAVCADIAATRLADLDSDPETIGRLLGAMQAASTPIKPDALGIVGEAHLLERLQPSGRHWYKRVKGNGPTPFAVEALLAETTAPAIRTGVNFSPTFADPLAGTLLSAPDFVVHGLTSFLYRCDATPGDGFATVLHIVHPALRFLDRGKTRLDASKELAAACGKALWSVCKTAREEARKRERDAGKAAREQERRLRERCDTTTVKELVFEAIPAAVPIATGNGRYPVSARTLFYKVRELLAGETDKDLDYGYFSQTLLTEYQQRFGTIETLYYDPRGWLYEPHSGTEIKLGTREVDEYAFPAWCYDKILFVEKKGLWPILQRARLAERYDLAIVCAEGFSTTAARMLFAAAQRDKGYRLFVLHDCDPDGYNIARTLAESTARFPGHRIEVTDIGLRLDQAEALGILPERYTRKKALPSTLTLTKAERAFFIERAHHGRNSKITGYSARRYELNALSAPQLVALIENELEAHGADRKLIPPAPVVTDAARSTYHAELNERLREDIVQALDIEALVSAAADRLHGDGLLVAPTEAPKWIEERFADDRASSWEKALTVAIEHALETERSRIRDAALEAIERRTSR